MSDTNVGLLYPGEIIVVSSLSSCAPAGCDGAATAALIAAANSAAEA